MHRTSMFNLKLDISKSHGSFLFDINQQEELLDLFGLYSSLPLGYNHLIFKNQEFREAILLSANVKVPNCELDTPEAEKFLHEFTTHPSMRDFSFFHFSCTGALAIEASIKTAIDYKRASDPQIITFKGSFHGINSYGGFLTDRSGSSSRRLEGMPGGLFGEPLPNPVMSCRDGQLFVDDSLTDRTLEEVEFRFRRDEQSICAVLLEPIQCTAGDLLFDLRFLKGIRDLCSQFNVPLIFDEVQTGFGGTGTMWYFEQCGIVPDIVVFGKKSQVSGIMVREQFGEIFKNALRLEVTWDGDLLDMIRCRWILQAFQKFNILENVISRGKQLGTALREIASVENVRQVGLLIAFDFKDTGVRDEYVRSMRHHKTIVLPTQEKSIRWRPNLAMTDAEAKLAISRSAKCYS